MRKSGSVFMAREYWESTAVNSKMSFSRIASWNAAVKIWILWLIGGGGCLLVEVEGKQLCGLQNYIHDWNKNILPTGIKIYSL